MVTELMVGQPDDAFGFMIDFLMAAREQPGAMMPMRHERGAGSALEAVRHKQQEPAADDAEAEALMAEFEAEQRQRKEQYQAAAKAQAMVRGKAARGGAPPKDPEAEALMAEFEAEQRQRKEQYQAAAKAQAAIRGKAVRGGSKTPGAAASAEPEAAGGPDLQAALAAAGAALKEAITALTQQPKDKGAVAAYEEAFKAWSEALSAAQAGRPADPAPSRPQACPPPLPPHPSHLASPHAHTLPCRRSSRGRGGRASHDAWRGGARWLGQRGVA